MVLRHWKKILGQVDMETNIPMMGSRSLPSGISTGCSLSNLVLPVMGKGAIYLIYLLYFDLLVLLCYISFISMEVLVWNKSKYNICKWNGSNIIIDLYCKNTEYCNYSTISMNTVILYVLINSVHIYLMLPCGSYSLLSIDFSRGSKWIPVLFGNPSLQLSPVNILLIITMHPCCHW